MKHRLLFGVLAWSSALSAAPWDFGAPLEVAGGEGTPHFHHLDGAGRRHVAATDDAVALVWEDDRDATPQVYAVIKPHAVVVFPPSMRLSDGGEAYEPAIVALDRQRWLAAWEQDGQIRAVVVDAKGIGPRVTLAGSGSRQVTLATAAQGRVAAVWARDRDGGQLLESAELHVTGRSIEAVSPTVQVAPLDDHPYQGHPAATWTADGHLVVAWEDRRAGHTRLFHSRSSAGGDFAAERQLNEHSGPHDGSPDGVGLGSGVMRVMVARAADGELRAIWLDKRNPASGYAVWGASSDDQGDRFGPNVMVQDEFGATVPQWHAALAGGERFVAAWDDTRESWGDQAEPGDIILSWTDDGRWSADLVVPGASGPGYQGSPAVDLDPSGDLHLIWLDAGDLSSPTRLRYLHARRASGEDGTRP